MIRGLTRTYRQHGFTLIEMIIATLLLSMISLIGYHSIMFGLERWNIASKRSTADYNFLQSMNWLRNKLGAAERVGIPELGNGYLFAGDARSIEFVARYDRSNQSGLYINRITLDAERKKLLIEYLLLHPDIDPEAAETSFQQVTLLSGIEALRLDYYGRSEDGVTAWFDTWNDPKHFPRLVRLRLETENGHHHDATIAVMTANTGV